MNNVEDGNVKLKRGDVAPSRCQTIKLLSPLWGLMQCLGSTKDAFTIEAVLECQVEDSYIIDTKFLVFR